MTILNVENLNGSATWYADLFDKYFTPNAETQYQKYCVVSSEPFKRVELPLIQSFPESREWNGDKEFIAPRAASVTHTAQNYHASLPVDKADWLGNRAFVMKSINAWLSGGADGFVNKQVVTKLLAANSTSGHDGVNVASTSHPLDDGTTQSNLGTDALSDASYIAATQAMMNFRDRNGMPLGIVPKALIVPTGLVSTARHILQAKQRVQGMTAAGAKDATASIVTAGAIDNIFTTDGVELIVEPRLTAGKWFLIGEKPGSSLRPLAVNFVQPPTPTDSLSDFMRGAPEILFSIEGLFSIGFTDWALLYMGNA